MNIPMHLPILGQRQQPVDVIGWTLVVQARCHCQQGGFVALIVNQNHEGRAGAATHCPACQRMLRIAGINVDSDGQVEFQVFVGDTPQPVRLD